MQKRVYTSVTTALLALGLCSSAGAKSVATAKEPTTKKAVKAAPVRVAPKPKKATKPAAKPAVRAAVVKPAVVKPTVAKPAVVKPSKPIAKKPTSQPAKQAAKPTKAVMNDRDKALGRLFFFFFNGPFAPSLLKRDLDRLAKQSPNDLEVGFGASLMEAIFQRNNKPLIAFCSKNKAKFVDSLEKLYCAAAVANKLGYRARPTRALAKEWLVKLDAWNSKNPSNIKYLKQQAVLMRFAGKGYYKRIKLARTSIEKALFFKPGNAWLQLYMQTLTRYKRNEATVVLQNRIQQMEKIIKRYPTLWEAHYYLLRNAHQLKSFDPKKNFFIEQTMRQLKANYDTDLWAFWYAFAYSRRANRAAASKMAKEAILNSKSMKDPDTQAFFVDTILRGLVWRNADEVEKIASKLLVKFPKSNAIRGIRMKAYSRMRKYTEAEKDAVLLSKGKLSRRMVNDIIYLYQWRIRKPAKAIPILDAYLKQQPNETWAYKSRAQLHAKNKDYTKAEKDYGLFLTRSKPLTARVIRQARYFYVWRVKKPELLMGHIETYLKKNPGSDDILFERAKIYARMKKYKKAKADYHAILTKHPLNKNYLKQAFNFYSWKLSNALGVIPYLNIYIQRKPNDVWGWVQRGDAYKRAKDYTKAEADFNKVLTMPNIKNVYTFQRIASFHQYNRRDLKKAVGVMDIAIKRMPRKATLYMRRADYLSQMNRYKEADLDFQSALRLKASSYWNHRKYIQFLQTRKRHNEALTLLTRLVKKNAFSKYYKNRLQSMYLDALRKAGKVKDADRFALTLMGKKSLVQQGDYFSKRKKYAKAISLYTRFIDKKVKELKGKNLHNNYELRNTYRKRADLYHKLKQYNKSIADREALIKMRPKYYYGYSQLAYYYRWKMKKRDEAIKVWTRYIKVAPKESRGYFERASLLAYNKKYKEAAVDYKKAFSLKKKITRWDVSRIANFYRYKLRQPAAALQYWDEYLLKNKKDYSAYRYRASLLASMKKYKEAESDYQTVIRLRPRDSYSYSSLVSFYRYKLRQPSKALTVWHQFIKQFPKKVEGYSNRASIYNSMKMYKQAILDYEKAIQINPRYSYSYSRLASLYRYSLKDLNKALITWDRYLKLRPWDNNGYKNRAQLYGELKMYSKAIKDWSRVLKHAKYRWGRKSAYKGRAKVYLQQKQYQLAINDLNSALKLETSSWSKKYILLDLAKSYEGLKDYQRALDSINRAYPPKKRTDGRYRLRRAKLLLLSGQEELAIEAYMGMCSGPKKLSWFSRRSVACKELNKLKSKFKAPISPF